MWIKADYRMITPAVIKPYLPFDGAISYYYAKKTGFKYKNEEGLIYGNLPANRYKYIDELPIKKTVYKDKWFYNVSGMLFFKKEGIEEVLTVKSTIVRKYIEDTALWEYRFPNIEKVKWNYGEKSAKGKERAYMVKVDTIFYPEFSIILQPDENKEQELLDILEDLKTIGKKVNQGYGRVEFLGYEQVKVEDFRCEGVLIRPVPKDLIEDKDYLEVEMRLFTPYYINNRKHSDTCYLDKTLAFNKVIERKEVEPEVIF